MKPTLNMIFIGIAFLTMIVLFSGWDDIREAIRNVSAAQLVTLLIMQVITLCLVAYQWFFLLSKKSPALPFWEVMVAHMSGSLVESVTPSVRLGGEAAKLYLFRQITGLSHEDLTGILVVRKFVSIVPFFILCAAMLVISLHVFTLPIVVYAAFGAMSSVFLLAWLLWRHLGQAETTPPDQAEPSAKTAIYPVGWLQKLRQFFQRASASSQHLVTSREVGLLAGISFVIWVLYPAKVYYVARVLGLEMTPLLTTLGTYTAYILGLVPLLPGGLGTFEGSMALVLSSQGISLSQGLAIALLTRLATYWFPLLVSVGAAWVALRRGYIRMYGRDVKHHAIPQQQ